MEDKIRLKELAKEAVKLIKEFIELEALLGECPYGNIRRNRSGSKITVVDYIYGEKLEFKLTQVSSIFSDEMEGFGPCGSGFYEAISLAKSSLDYEFKNMDKKEFIKHAGMICYIKSRCEEIYKRLEEIEREASKLM